MKHLTYLTLLSIVAVLSPLSMFARDKNQHSVDIPDAVQVGSTQLELGNYKAKTSSWDRSSPDCGLGTLAEMNLHIV